MNTTPLQCLSRAARSMAVFVASIVLLPVFAAQPVLILNSDGSVDKYGAVQKAFTQTLATEAVQVDLAAARNTETQVRRLIRDNDPQYIFCIGSKAYLTAQKLAANKNLILASALNWKRLPTGATTYTIANELPAEMELTLFRYFLPKVRRIGILYSMRFNKEWFEASAAAARDVGVELVGQEVSRPGDVRRTLQQLLPRVDALWLIPDPTVLSNEESLQQIFKAADVARKPILTYNPAFADLGAAIVVSPDVPTMGRQAAQLVADLSLRKPVSDRVQSPAGSDVTLNLRKVNEYSLELNEEALGSVNRVIR